MQPLQLGGHGLLVAWQVGGQFHQLGGDDVADRCKYDGCQAHCHHYGRDMGNAQPAQLVDERCQRKCQQHGQHQRDEDACTDVKGNNDDDDDGGGYEWIIPQPRRSLRQVGHEDPPLVPTTAEGNGVETTGFQPELKWQISYEASDLPFGLDAPKKEDRPPSKVERSPIYPLDAAVEPLVCQRHIAGDFDLCQRLTPEPGGGQIL